MVDEGDGEVLPVSFLQEKHPRPSTQRIPNPSATPRRAPTQRESQRLGLFLHFSSIPAHPPLREHHDPSGIWEPRAAPGANPILPKPSPPKPDPWESEDGTARAGIPERSREHPPGSARKLLRRGFNAGGAFSLQGGLALAQAPIPSKPRAAERHPHPNSRSRSSPWLPKAEVLDLTFL